MRLAVIAATGLALLPGPAAAEAATMVGSDFGGPAAGSNCPAGCTWVQDKIEGSFVETPRGVITS